MRTADIRLISNIEDQIEGTIEKRYVRCFQAKDRQYVAKMSLEMC